MQLFVNSTYIYHTIGIFLLGMSDIYTTCVYKRSEIILLQSLFTNYELTITFISTTVTALIFAITRLALHMSNPPHFIDRQLK